MEALKEYIRARDAKKQMFILLPKLYLEIKEKVAETRHDESYLRPPYGLKQYVL